MKHFCRKFRCLRPLLLVALMGAAGCGAIKGETTPQTVHLNDLSLPEPLVPIELGSVSSTPNAAELHTSGVYEWGKFDDADLASIRASLERTLKEAVDRYRLDESEKVRVYVVIRKYIVAASNVAASALATVDWCAARKDGTLLYRELFYATDYGQFVGTLGGLKNTVHRAIVGRIAESGLVIASRNNTELTLPRKTEHTFDKLEDALKTLPESAQSWGLVVPGPPFYFPGSAPVTIPWQSAGITESVSCEKSLLPN